MTFKKFIYFSFILIATSTYIYLLVAIILDFESNFSMLFLVPIALLSFHMSEINSKRLLEHPREF